jgi:hypothetical protein
MARGIVTAAAITLLVAHPAAFDTMLDPEEIQQAIAIGQSRLAQERERFHRGYRVMVGRAPVDYVEIVTPLRRIVLAAEAGATGGDRRFGQRQALELLAASGNQIDIYVELSFHPLNTFVGVPEYQVTLVPGGGVGAGEPLTVDRIPRYGPRVSGVPLPAPAGPVVPGGSQPMLGGTIIAHVDGGGLEATGVYEVVLRDVARLRQGSGGQAAQASELARARVDLATMR